MECKDKERCSIRVFLVDDHLQFIEAAARFLTADPNIEIVGQALSGRDALKQISLLHPDLVLMDLRCRK